MKPSTQYEIPFILSGIPCLIGITYYFRQKPLGKWCNSDLDAQGYSESEWIILDRKGYKAPWLEKKINKKIENEINEAIEEYFDR